MQGFASSRYDLPRSTKTSRYLVVASSYRSGSTFLSSRLWQDGRFGAPFEYANFEKHMAVMMARLQTDNLDPYFEQLVLLRSTRNGVFSLKAHFHHFEAATRQSSRWNAFAEGARYLYVNRQNKIAQAVSMAKALQTNAWTSFESSRRVPLFYSAQLIDECLREIMAQASEWWRWFEANAIQPFVVNHEEFVTDPSTGVEVVAEWLGVAGDAHEAIVLPEVERQSDAVSEQWISRYVAESKAGRAPAA